MNVPPKVNPIEIDTNIIIKTSNLDIFNSFFLNKISHSHKTVPISLNSNVKVCR